MRTQSRTPLYFQIYYDLKKKIGSGEYSPGTFLPSERELHEHYRVERATVRRALDLLVKDDLLVKIPGAGSKVKDAADSENATAVSASRSTAKNNIAFILPGDAPEKITEPFTSNVFYHFERECRKRNYHLFYANPTAEDCFSSDLFQSGLAGIVWVSRVSANLIERAKALGIPSVLISNAHPDCVSILCDNSSGIYQAVEHLVSLGHQKIAYLGGIPDYLNAMERRDGYLSAVTHFGLPYLPELVLTGDWSFDSGRTCVEALLKQTQDFTAICCANDTMALGAMKALSAAGLSVPKDVSVIGFDDIESCRYSTPPLSTIRIDTAAFARQIMRSLSDLISDHEAVSPVKILMQVQLCIRESTAPAENA